MKKLLTIMTIVFLSTATMSWANGFPIQYSSIDAELKNDYAIGALGDYYLTGIGIGIQANFDITPINNLGIFGGIDYSYGISKTVWVDSFHDLSLTTGISYKFETGSPVSIIPELGYGICIHLLQGDIDRDGNDSTSIYLDQMLTFSIKAAYSFNEKISIYFSPDVKYYIESENNAILLGYNLGVRIKL